MFRSVLTREYGHPVDDLDEVLHHRWSNLTHNPAHTIRAPFRLGHDLFCVDLETCDYDLILTGGRYTHAPSRFESIIAGDFHSSPLPPPPPPLLPPPGADRRGIICLYQRPDYLALRSPSFHPAHFPLASMPVKDEVHCVTWFPNESALFLTASNTHQLSVWDTENFVVATTISLGAGVEAVDTQHHDTVTLAASKHHHARTELVAAVTPVNPHAVTLVDLASGSATHILQPDVSRFVVQDITWSPTHPHLLACTARDATVSLFDIRKSGSVACLMSMDVHHCLRLEDAEQTLAEWMGNLSSRNCSSRSRSRSRSKKPMMAGKKESERRGQIQQRQGQREIGGKRQREKVNNANVNVTPSAKSKKTWANRIMNRRKSPRASKNQASRHIARDTDDGADEDDGHDDEDDDDDESSLMQMQGLGLGCGWRGTRKVSRRVDESEPSGSGSGSGSGSSAHTLNDGSLSYSRHHACRRLRTTATSLAYLNQQHIDMGERHQRQRRQPFAFSSVSHNDDDRNSSNECGTRVRFTPDGSTLVTRHARRGTTSYDVLTGRVVSHFSDLNMDHTERTTIFEVTPDGLHFFTFFQNELGDGQMAMVDVTDGGFVHAAHGPVARDFVVYERGEELIAVSGTSIDFWQYRKDNDESVNEET